MTILLLIACSPEKGSVNSELNEDSLRHEKLTHADELAAELEEKKQAKINEKILILALQDEQLQHEEALLNDAQRQKQDLEQLLLEAENLRQISTEQTLIESAKIKQQAQENQL